MYKIQVWVYVTNTVTDIYKSEPLHLLWAQVPKFQASENVASWPTTPLVQEALNRAAHSTVCNGKQHSSPIRYPYFGLIKQCHVTQVAFLST